MKGDSQIKFDPKVFKIFIKVIETSSLKPDFEN
ncbi:MAG: hypothetical protein ACJAXJ_001489 [Colwellia sp.]|jgi:hypothetical protein